MTSWVRLWLDMPTDPKWRVIAKKSGQPLPCVIALYTMLLTVSGGAVRPGEISDMSIEDAAAALDMDEDAVSSILSAMEGRVISSGCLSGWEKRQPKREDDSSQRVREYRERKKQEVKRDVTQSNAPEAEADTEAASAAAREVQTDDGGLTVELAHKLSTVAGCCNPDYAKIIDNQHTVRQWLALGFSAEMLESLIRTKAASSRAKPRSLKYYDGAVRDMLQVRSGQQAEGASLAEQILRRKAAA